MGSVEKLAEEVRGGLHEALPGLRKTILRKLPLAIAAMLEARTANTAMVANLLPLAVERQDRREQWLRRLLANRLIVSHEVMAPFAKRVLEQAAAYGQTVLLSMDQTDLGERFAGSSVCGWGIGPYRLYGKRRRGKRTSALRGNASCWSASWRGCPRERP